MSATLIPGATVHYQVDHPAAKTLECGCVLGKYRAEKLCRYHQDEDDAIYRANQARRVSPDYRGTKPSATGEGSAPPMADHTKG